MTGSGRGRAVLLAIGMTLLLVCTACDWTQYMGGPGLTGATVAETTITPANVAQLAPTYTIALPGSSKVVLSPVTSAGRLFAGTDDGHLVAASTDGTNCSGTPTVCQPLWTASIPNLDTASPPVVSGNFVYDVFTSSGTDSTSVVAAFDQAGTTNCSGSPKVCLPVWTAPGNSVSGVNVDQGTLFVDDQVGQQLEAFDAAGVTGCSGSPTRTCLPEWTGSIHSLAVPSVAGGRVYVPTSFGSTPEVAVFDESGSINCSGSPEVCQPLFTVTLPAHSSGSVSVSNGVGYVEGEMVTPPNSQLVAFDATGATHCSGVPAVCQPLWTALLSGAAWFNTPAVSKGRVYAASSTAAGGVIDQFDAAGVTGCSGSPSVCTRLVTTAPVGDPRFGSPVVANGLVMEKNDIYAATDTSSCSGGVPIVCAPLWSAPATSLLSGSIISNGTVFIPGADGSVHAYRVPGT